MTGTVTHQLFGSPAEKILRRLRFFDRVPAFDLFIALGVGDDERQNYHAALSSLAKKGKVKRYMRKGQPTLYELVR